MKYLIHIPLSIIVLLTSLVGYTGEEVFNSRIEGTDVTIGATDRVFDEKMALLQTGANAGVFWDYLPGQVNKLILGIDESLITSLIPLSSGFSREVTIEITSYDYNNVIQGSPFTVILTVDRDLLDDIADRTRDVYVFTSPSYKFKYKILDIKDENGTSNPVAMDHIFIESEIIAERYYEMSTSAVPFQSGGLTHELKNTDGNTQDDEIDIQWDYYQGAEEYELEWTYINNYKENYITNNGDLFSASQTNFTDRDFELNSSRIRTTAQHYQIPIIYDRGFLIYRIRAVGKILISNELKTIKGRWSSYDVSGNTLVSDFLPHYAEIMIAHDSKKNWQYTGTFAEEGKRKDVISYFDGSLRNRQSVTRINSDNQTIVGESFYDHQGRGAIQALPAPTGESTLRYYESFNQNALEKPYNRTNFDEDDNTGTCTITADPMKITSGSSKYYSNTATIGNHQDYVPDALGFPFTQVEYTPDNTGRIRRQSGVGINHQLGALGNSHDTRYFYGQPYQEELDRLFGYEVGYKSRYKKNMVVDANGQVSVTYLDPQGRTIATALSGTPPINVDGVTLDGVAEMDGITEAYVGASQTLTIDLLNKIYQTDVDTGDDDNERFSTGNYGPLVDGLRHGTEIIVPIQNQIQDWYYKITMTPFTDSCMSEDSTNAVHFPVIYDFTAVMTDQCGTNKIEALFNPTNNDPLFQQIAMPSGDYIYPTSNGATEMTDGTASVSLPLGSYTFGKNLTVNQAALEDYTEQYITLGQAEGCISELADFQAIEGLTMDPADCSIGCNDCLEQTLITFGGTPPYWDYDANGLPDLVVWNGFYSSLGLSGQISTSDWEALYESCTDACTEVTLCEANYQAMLEDMSPSGQYGLINTGTNTITATAPLSIFNLANQLPGGVNWHSPVYTNEDGTNSVIIVTPNGTNFTPAVINTTLVNLNSQGDYETAPSNLSYLGDFVFHWQSSWAKNLIPYHPEYCYWEWCDKQENLYEPDPPATGPPYTSGEFDRAMLSSQYDGNSATLDVTLGGVTVNLLALMTDDPFFNTGNDWMTNNVSPNITISGNAYVQTRMTGALLNYQGSGMSMMDYGAYSVTCATTYGTGCTLTPFISLSTPAEKAAAWEYIKNFYLSAKALIEQDLRDYFAIAPGQECYNACIGSEEPFNPWENEFADYTGGNLTGPYFEATPTNQPCHQTTRSFYLHKIRRWGHSDYSISAEASGVGPAIVQAQSDYEMYQETGKCPVIIDLSILFNGLATSGNLTQATSLQSVPEFGPDLYSLFSGPGYSLLDLLSSSPPAYIPYTWNPTLPITGTTLNVNITGGASICTGDDFSFTLENNAYFTTNWTTYGTSWTIESVEQLTSTGLNSYRFIAMVDTDLADPDNDLVEVAVDGSTCFDLECDASDFADVCDPNDLAQELLTVVNTVNATGNFMNTAYNFTTPIFGTMVLDNLLSELGATSLTELQWQYTAANKYIENTTNNVKIILLENLGDIDLATDQITQLSSIYTNGIVSYITVGYTDGNGDPQVEVVLTDITTQLALVPLTEYPTQLQNCCNSPLAENIDGPELIINNDFSQGDASFTSDATYDGSCNPLWTYNHFYDVLNYSYPCYETWENTSGTQFNYDHSVIDHTTGSDNFLFYNDEVSMPQTVWSTTIAVPVVQYETYDFSYWMQAYSKGESFSWEVSINDGSGSPNTVIQSNQIPASGNGSDWMINDWTQFGGEFTAATNEVTISIIITGGNNAIVALDDISLKKVECECTLSQQTPISCHVGYIDYVNALGVSTNRCYCPEPVSFNYFGITEEDFCAGAYQYCAGAYINYLTTHDFTDTTSPHYVSLEEYCAGSYDQFETQYTSYYNAVSATESNPLTLAEVAAAGYSVDYIDNYIAYYNATLPQTPLTLDSYTAPYTPVDVNQCSTPHMGEVLITGTDPCADYINNLITQNAGRAYKKYIEEVEDDFKQRYIAHAINTVVEELSMTTTDQEYHYTLFYYDQSGSLVRTVPPNGVDKLDLTTTASVSPIVVNGVPQPVSNPYTPTTIGEQIKIARKYKDQSYASGLVNHSYFTTYEYSTLNQLRRQSTPDGGTSIFWYDRLSRIVASQNADQAVNNEYSYTRYDAIGRIIEAGQLQSTTTPDDLNLTAPFDPLVDLNASDYPYNGSWLGVTVINEVSRTYYDDLNGMTALPIGVFTDNEQTHLRNRISRVTYQEVVADPVGAPYDVNEYDRATHYSFDVHGNVKELVQENKSGHLVTLGHQYKRMEYTYDLISGNVLQVAYQPGEVDGYYHRYEYDADNRITNVLTSEDLVNWSQDAKYFYYEHGPLARTEIGHDKVQGCDYAYTIQGWLKSINGNVLKNTTEMGKDGDYPTTSNLHRNIGKDAYGFSLSYYGGDYTSRTGTTGNQFLNDLTAGVSITTNRNLYNGNIAQMAVALSDQNEAAIALMANNYTYDQLNRLKSMTANKSGTTGYTGATASGDYYVALTYDPNGNIITLDRNAHGIDRTMDRFSYNYTSGTNQLTHVTDNPALSGFWTEDIDDGQLLGNYKYYENGELKSDDQEAINNIDWYVTGKVKKIYHTPASFEDDISFEYDGMGNRVTKIVDPKSTQPTEYTYYIRDAQGNTMATYKSASYSTGLDLKIMEKQLYGSSRLGLINKGEVIASVIPAHVPSPETTNAFYTGERAYELTNHLGNVLSVVSDKKIVKEDLVTNDIYFDANVVSYSDYYPFGMLMPDRHGNSETYRYGFQGQEKDDEIKGAGNSYGFNYRMMDTRLGRWLSIDPKATAWASPYSSMENNPILNIDALGDTVYKFNKKGIFVSQDNNTYVNGDQNGISMERDNSLMQYFFGNKETSFNDQNDRKSPDGTPVKNDMIRMDAMISEYGSTKPLVYVKSSDWVKETVKAAVPIEQTKEISIIEWGRQVMNNTGKAKFLSENSRGEGASLDFWINNLVPEMMSKGFGGMSVDNEATDLGPFYILDNTAYNMHDAGNFLWGAATSYMNVGKTSALLGATSDAKKNTGSQDPPEDQSAISNGHDKYESIKEDK